LVFVTRRPLLFRFLVFRMPILRGVESIGSRLRGLVSFWVPRLFLDLLANSLVYLSLPQKPSMLLPLVVAPSCFGSHTRWVLLVRTVPMYLMCDSTVPLVLPKISCFTLEPNT
jgi:hypothetical protein